MTEFTLSSCPEVSNELLATASDVSKCVVLQRLLLECVNSFTEILRENVRICEQRTFREANRPYTRVCARTMQARDYCLRNFC